jgi:hypothetical protein
MAAPRGLRASIDLTDRYWVDNPPQVRAQLVKAIATPNRVMIKVHPVKVWHWDLGKMAGVR